MLRLRDIMTRDVLALTPDMTLREAAELLSERHVSGAPVLDGRKVVGVLSTSDVLEFAAAQPANIEAPVDADEWPEDEEAADQDPGGYFSWNEDSVQSDLLELGEHLRGGGRDRLSEHSVGEIMTESLLSLPPSAEVPAAADFMRRSGVHRLLVVDHDELIGIVSTMDVVRAVADHRIEVRRFVFDTAAR